MNTESSRPGLLLHSCCGPCSTAVIERLAEDYEITVLFYNPNITDREEYEKRLDSQKKVIEKFNAGTREKDKNSGESSYVRLIADEYIPEDFIRAADGLEDEPEGGKRCAECFKLRLKRAAEMAEKEKLDYYTTTLTVSPHKNAKLIGEIGMEIGASCNCEYLSMDFKKKDGFKRSIELSKEYELYRQNYCGCEFSKWWK